MPVPAAVEISWVWKSRIEPDPTSKVLTFPFVLNVPVEFSVTVEPLATTIFPTWVLVIKVTNEFAVKLALLLFVQPVVNGPAALVPQLAAVHVADEPFVFQN